nr:hypothetical protein CFP56_25433 [Quercus suber]
MQTKGLGSGKHQKQRQTSTVEHHARRHQPPPVHRRPPCPYQNKPVLGLMISGSELGHYDEEASNDKRIGVDSTNVVESKHGVVAIDDDLF